MENIKIPTIEEIKSFLTDYEWHFKETNSDGKDVILAPYTLDKEHKGILISFRVEGEFVMVSTVGLLKEVPSSFSQKLLELNDRIKLVKLYIVDQKNPEMIDVDLGFELWNESWNKETFHSFMDMLGFGIEKALDTASSENIPHQTSFVTYS